MDFAGINTPVAAFVAGLTTSLHCVAMCGPLACALSPARGDTTDPRTLLAAYHVSRVLAYTTLGLVVGAVGQAPLAFLGETPLRLLPWIFVVFFLLIAFRLDKRLPRFAWLTRTQWKWQQLLRGRSRLLAAAGLGLGTPLLPCGPLYFIVTIAAFSGSAALGAELMLAFALGTLPLLWLAHLNYGWIRARLSPVTLGRAQSAVALTAALLVCWRLRGAFGLGGTSLSSLICWSSP